ncbi:LapA family protein [Methylovorus menthalis]|uniref:LapA family protein n=1 Tax=Methylovorus menthalis TaxID=1002227 RepID=UPI001E47A120|nr:LapA family protein [Methylovorus menthalis]MCB4812012.1 LapA family protein [Methylovorus menthalis]
MLLFFAFHPLDKSFSARLYLNSPHQGGLGKILTMRYIYIPLGTLLFIMLLGFALKNSQPAELHYYLGLIWQAPLSLMLLITFSIGVLAGILACVGVMIKQKRQMMSLRKELKTLNKNIPQEP